MPLSDTSIRQAKSTDKAVRLYDSGGLYLEVTPSGSKLWRWKFRIAGKERRLALGSYPATSLKDARQKRDLAKGQLESGVDPSASRRAEKIAGQDHHSNSLERIAHEWLYVKKHEWTEKQFLKEEGRLKKHVFPYVGSRPISDVGVSDIRQLIERPMRAGHLEQAHRLRFQLSRVFKFAIATERADRDPAADLSAVLPGRRKQRHPTITAPEKVGELLRVIDAFEGTFPVACALKLAPLWFCRPGEIRMAEWSQIAIESAEPVYVVPPANRKLRKAAKEAPDTPPHVIPLSRQAIEILKELREVTGRGKFLFPGARDPKRNMSDGAVNAALARLGFKGIIVGHGFRHMASTLLREQGWSRESVEAQLSHEIGGTEGVYNLAKYLPERRKMMQAWADYLDTLKEQGL
ncbi:integrase arm-type DNA-binding domain-containing protein [Lysobacter sp. HDW10]|uniref:tyrosine-type recombinase/integrase n=1 Tax=Lysobacter sp. HDW10 TaxID=2714936 RepID=UPI00140E705C|nr:integrase arm-type DNA-binding domain-containing protein [Lysobacter sp. HDW10]QIK80563.1 integrase arm-type DNA-binding domain-containing protein [Lysobacter sp. HDW10]